MDCFGKPGSRKMFFVCTQQWQNASPSSIAELVTQNRIPLIFHVLCQTCWRWLWLFCFKALTSVFEIKMHLRARRKHVHFESRPLYSHKTEGRSISLAIKSLCFQDCYSDKEHHFLKVETKRRIASVIGRAGAVEEKIWCFWTRHLVC